MELRFGLNGRKEHTQKQVADKLGISQSYISRLEKKIIRQLKIDDIMGDGDNNDSDTVTNPSDTVL